MTNQSSLHRLALKDVLVVLILVSFAIQLNAQVNTSKETISDHSWTQKLFLKPSQNAGQNTAQIDPRSSDADMGWRQMGSAIQFEKRVHRGENHSID